MKRLGLLGLALAAGCGREGAERSAPTGALALQGTEARALVRELAAQRPFTTRLAAALALPDDVADVALPLRVADGFALQRGPFRVEVRPRADSLAVAERFGAARVFRGVAPSTDAIVFSDGHAIEDAWALRDAKAAHTLSWAVHAGPGATLRLREDRVELVDAKGYVQLAAAPPFAIDAEGVRRELHPSLVLASGEPGAPPELAAPSSHDATMTLSVDATGLAYPITVDPLWGSSAPMRVARSGHSALLLPTGKVLVLGGGSAAAELYDPASNTWSDWGTLLNAPSSPSAVLFPSGTFAGKVLSITNTAAELFDPVAKTSVAKASLAGTSRITPFVTLLNDGSARRDVRGQRRVRERLLRGRRLLRRRLHGAVRGLRAGDERRHLPAGGRRPGRDARALRLGGRRVRLGGLQRHQPNRVPAPRRRHALRRGVVHGDRGRRRRDRGEHVQRRRLPGEVEELWRVHVQRQRLQHDLQRQRPVLRRLLLRHDGRRVQAARGARREVLDDRAVRRLAHLRRFGLLRDADLCGRELVRRPGARGDLHQEPRDDLRGRRRLRERALRGRGLLRHGVHRSLRGVRRGGRGRDLHADRGPAARLAPALPDERPGQRVRPGVVRRRQSEHVRRVRGLVGRVPQRQLRRRRGDPTGGLRRERELPGGHDGFVQRLHLRRLRKGVHDRLHHEQPVRRGVRLRGRQVHQQVRPLRR
jgi:hypothetical protein